MKVTSTARPPRARCLDRDAVCQSCSGIFDRNRAEKIIANRPEIDGAPFKLHPERLLHPITAMQQQANFNSPAARQKAKDQVRIQCASDACPRPFSI
jgi:hypothetical protein